MSDKTENRVPDGQQPIHTARFRLTPAAYTQLNYIVQRRGLKKRRLVTLALAVGVTLIYCLLTARPVSTTVLLMVTEALVVWPLSAIMDKVFLRYYAQRSQRLSPAALEEQCFEFYEDGFSSLMDAQFSMPFCIASMLYCDRPGPNWYERELFTDPRIITLARKIKAGPSQEDTLQGSFVKFQNGDFPVKHVTITMNDGTVYERTFSKQKGHPDNMLTREEFCDLFMNNATFVMPEEKAKKLMDFILDLENVEDMAAIGQLF